MARSGSFSSNNKRRLFFQAKNDSPTKRFSRSKLKGVCSANPELTPLNPKRASQKKWQGVEISKQFHHVHMVDGILFPCNGTVP